MTNTTQLSPAQKSLVDRLTAQAQAAAADPGCYSRGLTLGHGCHRQVVEALVRRGLVTVQNRNGVDTVDLAQ